MAAAERILESLDFLYTPSRDVARDLAHYQQALGAEAAWAIEAFGTRVAEVTLGVPGPRLVLAEHLEGEAPIMVFRVADLEAAIGELEARGATIEAHFGIPHGPCATVAMPGPQRLAIYQLTRPEADERFAGRRDFEPG
jgi:hypothetical protein